MLYGYARCSTAESLHRQDVERQKRELKAKGVAPENIYFEYQSGMKDDRLELGRLMDRVQAGDTIVVTEVSRLSRSTAKLCEIIKQVQDKQLCLVISGSMTLDCRPGHETDPMSKGMVMMWSVFAELEHDMICARVKSGMANAKAKGKVIGRPKVTAENVPESFHKYYELYLSGKLSVSEVSRLAGLSRNTVYKYINLLKN